MEKNINISQFVIDQNKKILSFPVSGLKEEQELILNQLFEEAKPYFEEADRLYRETKDQEVLKEVTFHLHTLVDLKKKVNKQEQDA